MLTQPMQGLELQQCLQQVVLKEEILEIGSECMVNCILNY